MNTRALRREGTLGLLILLGIGLFSGLILWLRGFQPGGGSFRFIIAFDSANGLRRGAAVRYRGVNVGRVADVEPGPNGVNIVVEITRRDLLIPRKSQIISNQSGLVSETAIDITPLGKIADGTPGPTDPACNVEAIICQNTTLVGETGASFEELLRVYGQLAETLNSERVLQNLSVTTQNIGEAASSVSQLSKNLASLSLTAEKRLSNVATAADSIGRAADKLGGTAGEVNTLLNTNRASIARTLDSLSQTSADVRVVVASLRPLAENGQFVRNLEELSANAAAAAISIRSLSSEASNPATLTALRDTLESARTTFQNAQKITADLDELTGDPQFRTNLRQLVNGLSSLVSTTNELERQLQPVALSPALSTSFSFAQKPTATATPATLPPVFQPQLDADPSKALAPANKPDRPLTDE